MQSKLFKGSLEASEKEKDLKEKIKKAGVSPLLHSILVGSDPSSRLYLSLKKKAARKVGAKLEIVRFPLTAKVNKIKDFIKKSNRDKKVSGIMIQLPLPGALAKKEGEIINLIEKTKDVDGMRKQSLFTPPVVKAVEHALNKGLKVSGGLEGKKKEMVVVGATGFVGGMIAWYFEKQGYKVTKASSLTRNLKGLVGKYDIVVSATGKAGLIKKDMVKRGALVIDVGSPKGDVKVDGGFLSRVSFVSAVPGGVGPLTIYYLMENLCLSGILGGLQRG